MAHSQDVDGWNTPDVKGSWRCSKLAVMLHIDLLGQTLLGWSTQGEQDG
jgi:hypothetical protein